MRKNLLKILVAGLIGFFVIGCGGSGGNDDTTPATTTPVTTPVTTPTTKPADTTTPATKPADTAPTPTPSVGFTKHILPFD